MCTASNDCWFRLLLRRCRRRFEAPRTVHSRRTAGVGGRRCTGRGYAPPRWHRWRVDFTCVATARPRNPRESYRLLLRRCRRRFEAPRTVHSRRTAGVGGRRCAGGGYAPPRWHRWRVDFTRVATARPRNQREESDASTRRRTAWEALWKAGERTSC